MNKSLAKLLSSAVVLGSVFFLATKQQPRHKIGNELKRPIPATDGKANPIGSYSNGCIIGAGAIAL